MPARLSALAFPAGRIFADNALLPAWLRETAAFAHRGLWGRRDLGLSREQACRVLELFFGGQRRRWFQPFYHRDYRDTYFAPQLAGGLYLKHYQVDRAPARVRRRNLLRRTLALKGMCLHYPLRAKGVPSVRPLLCAWREALPVAREAVLVCRAEPCHETLAQVMESSLDPQGKLSLARETGRFVAMLHRRRVWHGELPTNLLACPQAGGWRLVLCDLDEMRSISGDSPRHRRRYLADVVRTLERRAPLTVQPFLQAYRRAAGA
jgi:hypothetical protein